VITEYPPLTSSTLVVLSLGLLPRLPPSHSPSPPLSLPLIPPLAPLFRERAGTMCDGVRGCAGASGTDLPSTDLPSPPAVPLALLPVIFSFSSNYPRHVIRARSFSLLYSPLVPPALALPHRPVCSISLPPPPSPTHTPTLSVSLSHASSFTSRFVSSYSFCPLPSPTPSGPFSPALSLPRLLPLSEFPRGLPLFVSLSRSPPRSVRLAY